jgi:hypothetical protein
MTSAQARTVSNAVLVSAGVAAAYVILTTPPLRRLAITTLRWWLGGTVPLYLFREVRHAWAESARAA